MENLPEEDPISIWDQKVNDMDNNALVAAYKNSKQISGGVSESDSNPEGEWMMFLRRKMDERGLTEYI